jgi:mannose-6-phosphate isomerase-like protein (cupin superfamily)
MRAVRDNRGYAAARSWDVGCGVSVSIPLGTTFQVRSFGHEPLSAIRATMPPWPGNDEAILVEGPWPATLMSRSTSQ